jgi:hypothetical protein
MIVDNWNTIQTLVIYFENWVISLLRTRRPCRHEWIALSQCDVTRGGVWEWADRCGIFRSGLTTASTVIFVLLPCTSCTPPTCVHHVCSDSEFSVRTPIQRQASFCELWYGKHAAWSIFPMAAVRTCLVEKQHYNTYSVLKFCRVIDVGNYSSQENVSNHITTARHFGDKMSSVHLKSLGILRSVQ